jgi:sugar/nucleoside kinase (ribokinase family)
MPLFVVDGCCYQKEGMLGRPTAACVIKKLASREVIAFKAIPPPYPIEKRASTSRAMSSQPTTESTTTFHIVGDIFVDLFCFLQGNWPELGGDAHLSYPVSTMAGGSALNTATHLHSLVRATLSAATKNSASTSPSSVILQSMINPHDDYGKLILKHADEQGFPIVNCQNDKDDMPLATGHCLCIVANGDRTFMTHNGAMSLFEADAIKLDQIIATPSHVHLHIAGYYNMARFWHGPLQQQLETIREKRALLCSENNNQQYTTMISLNPQYDASNQWDGGIDSVFPMLDFAIMNHVEASNIVARGQKGSDGTSDVVVGGNDDDDDDDESDQQQLLQTWATHLATRSATTTFVITRGPMGAVALRGGSILAQQSAIPITTVIDPTGAGDAFAAGFLHGIWSWKSQAQQQDQALQSNNNDISLRSPVEAVQEGLLWGCSLASAAIQIRGASVPAQPKDIQMFHDQARSRRNR